MRWIDRTLIEMPFCVGLCTNEKDFHKELKRLKLPLGKYPVFPDNHATCFMFESSGDNKECIIVCINKPKKKDLIKTFGLLVHEAVHVFQFIKDDIGEDEPSIEFEAYSIQKIAQQLMWAYQEEK